MKDEEIVEIVKNLSKKLKDKQGKIADCDWHGSYLEQKQLNEYVTVHSHINKFPDRMMRNRAPNETDEELKYRKDNFEPITMPYWYKAVNSINGRIWSEQNHRITIEDEEVKKYFLEEYPLHGSIIQYFKSIVTPYKIDDPNAVMALKIGEISEYLDEGSGEVKLDETKLLEASGQIYGCEKIIKFEPNEYGLFLSSEKSKVSYNNKEVEEGLVFLFYTTDSIYKIFQFGKKVDYNFAFELAYKHDLGYLPVWKLKGIPKNEIKDTQEDLVYYSYFTPAVPLLNKVLKQDSSLDASISKTAYPVRTYYEDECDEPTCEQGRIPDWKEDGTKGYVNCPKCGGTGKGGLRFSPMKDHVLRPPRKNVTEEETALPFPAFAYVSPDTAILTFLKDKIKDEIIEAFTFINIDVSKSDNTGSQTAIEVKIDREELFSFLLHFASETFELLDNLMKAIYEVRYGKTEEVTFSIKKPRTFEIYTADELTVELGEAKKAGVPEIAIREMTKDYMTQRFSQQAELAKIIDVVFKVDGYATKDTTEIAILKSNGLIMLWQAVLHEEIYQFIDELSSANEDFFEWDLTKQKLELGKLARLRAAELTPNTAANIVDSLTVVE